MNAYAIRICNDCEEINCGLPSHGNRTEYACNICDETYPLKDDADAHCTDLLAKIIPASRQSDKKLTAKAKKAQSYPSAALPERSEHIGRRYK